MPTRKQRRRRAKEKRHEYEYVYVDEGGNEVAVEPAELKPSKNGRTEAKQAPRTRRGRAIEPPSWRRTLKRGLIFFPLMLLVVILISPKGTTTVQQISQTAFLLVFFLPFSYFMDALVWRSYQKRLQRSGKQT